MTAPRLVLASGSPRRQDLLRSLGIRFEVQTPGVDESRRPEEEPYDYVARVARTKVEATLAPDTVVVGADTTVVIDGRVLGKPAHPDEAESMLRRLSGDTHEVLTGVAVGAMIPEPQIVTGVESTLVRMLPMTDLEIVEYVATGEPMDKAGAYALGGIGAIYVDWVQGSPSSVVGLPLHTTARLLRNLGFDLLSFR
ncbi:MAG TPA: Maf family protein [Acidimicrobiia bacterium]|jgi:septum formation protein